MTPAAYRFLETHVTAGKQTILIYEVNVYMQSSFSCWNSMKKNILIYVLLF